MSNNNIVMINGLFVKEYILDFTEDEVVDLIKICNDIEFNYVNYNQLDKRKHFCFLLYVITNLTIKDLSNFKVKDFKYLISKNNSEVNGIIKKIFNLFYNDFFELKDEESYLFSQILQNKELSPINLKRDIQPLLIKYSYFYDFKINKIKWRDVL